MSDRILKSAIRKCKQYSKTKQWCGYLTPHEIVTLIESGAKPVMSSEWVLEYAKSSIKEGKSNPTWFYFYPNGVKMED